MGAFYVFYSPLHPSLPSIEGKRHCECRALADEAILPNIVILLCRLCPLMPYSLTAHESALYIHVPIGESVSVSYK
jgi:hypothetical protein